MSLPPNILSRPKPRTAGNALKGKILNWHIPELDGSCMYSITMISDGVRWYIFERLPIKSIDESDSGQLFDRQRDIDKIFQELEDGERNLDHLAGEYNDIEEELTRRGVPRYNLTIKMEDDSIEP